MKTIASPADIAVPRRWRWHHRELLRRRAILVRAQEARQSALQTAEENACDIADAAANETAHDDLVAALSLEGAELAEIDAALDRIRTGRYGFCEVTGTPIPAARLRAIPWARFAAPSQVAMLSNPKTS